METKGDSSHRIPALWDRSQTVIRAAILAGLGVSCAFASIIVMSPIYAEIATIRGGFGSLLSSYAVQPGFGLVALGYVRWRGDFHVMERIQKPSAEGIGWVVAGMVGYQLSVNSITRLLPVVGLSHGGHSGGASKWRVFLEQPELAVPGLAIMFLVMAPMEELLFRGVIHDTLEDAFEAPGRVVIGALLFGGMHFFLSGGLVSVIVTFCGGLLWGAGYERTKNLSVPMLAHAGYWLLLPV